MTYRPSDGVHDWPYWREHLRDAIDWGLFEPLPPPLTRWTYHTVADRGRSWGLSYTLDEPPEEGITLRRDGDRIAASGSGRMTIRSRAGCSVRADLPFERQVPTDECALGVGARKPGAATPSPSAEGRPRLPATGPMTPWAPLAIVLLALASRLGRASDLES